MTPFPKSQFLNRQTPPHIVTLVLIAGIGALSMSMFLPSLNNMATYYNTSYGLMQLSVSAYLGATALIQIFIGPISDRFGRRKVLFWALGIFVLASVGAALAPSIGVFLGFRMVQATVATGMVLSRAIVRDMVPQDQAASMIGYVTMGMALVPMLGPALGGVLDQIFGWQASFVFLAAAGLAVLVLCFYDLGETVRDGGMSFRAQIATYPELFTSYRFWGYAVCATLASGAFFAFLGGVSFVADRIYGLSPVWAGVALGSPALGYAAGNFISGRYSVRFGINKMILYGALAAGIGLCLSLFLGMAFGTLPALVFFGFNLVMGFGNGVILPNATAGILSVRPHLAGTASGLGGAIMIGGGALLSALAGWLLAGGTTALPLQAIMAACMVLALPAIWFVMRREKQLSAKP